MAYSRWSEGDVYLIRTDPEHWECIDCKLKDATVQLNSLDDVLEHYAQHTVAGHEVPEHAVSRVLVEMAEREGSCGSAEGDN